MRINRFIPAATIAAFLAILLMPTAFAHQDGCHSQHSCPSDSGSYVCGDLGIDTYCPKTEQSDSTDTAASTPSPAPIDSTEIIPLEGKQGTINRSSNIRSGPGTTFAIVGAGRAGQTVTLRGQTLDGSWYQIDEAQWIAASLVTSEEAAPEIPAAEPTETPQVAEARASVGVTSGTINRDANIRGGAGTSFPVIAAGKSGQAVSILEQNADGSWYRIGEQQWIAAFLFTPTLAQGNEPAPTPQPTIEAAPVAQLTPALPPYWQDVESATCGSFEWKVVDIRRPDGLWFLREGAVRENESFLVVYIEITNIGPDIDRLINIQPTVGASNLPDWDASYNAAWMMTGGQNNPWEYFNPGQVITIAAAYDVPRNDAYSFGMAACAGNLVNIGEWNALDKNALRANSN